MEDLVSAPSSNFLQGDLVESWKVCFSNESLVIPPPANCRSQDQLRLWNVENLQVKDGFLSQYAIGTIPNQCKLFIKSTYLSFPHSEENTLSLEDQMMKYLCEEFFIAKRELLFYEYLGNLSNNLYSLTPKYWGSFQSGGSQLLYLDFISWENEINFRNGITTPQLNVIIESLAKLHALSFHLEESKKLAILKELMTMPHSTNALINSGGLFDETWELMKRDISLSSLLSESEIKKLEELNLIEIERLFQLASTKSSPFLGQILSHGDLWAGNILFSSLKSPIESGNEKSTSDSLVHILDFQFLNIGEPMLDLLSIFYTSISPSVWCDVNYNFEPILRIYYKTLSDTITSHCQKENKLLPKSFEEFTFDELVKSFLKATMKGYVLLLVSYESLLSLMGTDDEKSDFIKRASLSTVHLLSSLS